MPLVQTRGAASAQGFGEFAQAATAVNYIEEVFSCFLYTGTGSALTITNNINLSTKGGLIWTKARSAANRHALVDTAQGGSFELASNLTNASNSVSPATTFSTTGYIMNDSATSFNQASTTYASWTFRKQPKFFDVVTYTGTGANRTIAHSLGSVPGCIIVKRTDTTANWAVYHRSLANTQYLVLNDTAAVATGATWWNSTTPTSSVFSVGTDASVNASGGTYVAYIYAHNAGGFGLTGTDNVISCGSISIDAVGNPVTVNLGYEPQWLLIKRSDSATNGNWRIIDNMRRFDVENTNLVLYPNLSNAETTDTSARATVNSTGFTWSPDNISSTYIYIAIRRGLMKAPTDATKVYNALTYSGTGATRVLNASIVPDIYMGNTRTPTGGPIGLFVDRLRGDNAYVLTTSTGAEQAPAPTRYFSGQTGFGLDTTADNVSGRTYVSWFMRRAASFFDEVCYTGTGANRTINHNLGVVPEMMIVKSRSTGGSWAVYHNALGNTKRLYLNTTAASVTATTTWNSTTPTSTVFSLGTDANVNDTFTYVWYGFATCAGVSKVGSYTGTGALQTINCGFAAGARWVMIKRTDTTGDWYVYDSARGITSGNDPYLLLNSTAAEVTGTNYVDTDASGFKVTAAAPAGLNASGGTYIFLAIA